VRGFLWGLAFVVLLAGCMELVSAQETETYTNEDLLNAALFGIGAILAVLGFIAGRQR